MNLKLTNAGINALLRTQAGDEIVFTKIKIGNGAAQAVATAEDLINPFKTLEITSITIADQKASLTTALNNANVEAGFRMTEIGVFAQDQDDDTTDILYAYGSEPEGTADYIAASGDSVLEVEITLDVFVSNAENVSAIINESLQYPTMEMWHGHVDDMNNPHQTTKEQVGLGNVPNVTTNDQTVTYTEASDDELISSGERHEPVFAKIARAIRRLYGHLADTSNPHNTTAAQVHAAAETHHHSASDINSGVLGVARGGTGKSSWVKDRLCYPSSVTAFAQLAFPSAAGMALHQGLSGAPYWAFSSASEYGSYPGHYRCGANQKSSITFAKGVPSIIFIIETIPFGDADFDWGILFPQQQRGCSFAIGTNNNIIHYHELFVSVDGNKVEWYSTYDADTQLDGSSSATYYYVGIR